jgi:spore coat polysaccharide biosynthesis predicted glycosyltransferase SpsG
VSESVRRPFVLCAVAAGPRVGFGHLVRCGVLVDALGASRQLVLRGPAQARDVALRQGWAVHVGRHVAECAWPDLLVVDDPSATHARRWIRLVRRLGIPVVALADGSPTHGRGADLIVDGSLVARPRAGAHALAGPGYAILSGRVAMRRALRGARESRRVLVALGGGAHVRRLGVAIAAALAAAPAHLSVDLAEGFSLGGHRPRLPAGCRWVHAPHGLEARLAAAAVAVVAGGVTMYEACALGTPTVAVPVVRAQRPAIVTAARAGAVVGVPNAGRPAVSVAAAVRQLIASPARRAQLGRRARRLIDGAGTARVVARIRASRRHL